MCRASRTPGRAGRTRPSPRRIWALICATCARCSTGTATQCALYGHFGQGCVHVRIDFDLKTARRYPNFAPFMDEAADLVVNYGGSLSGEHGDGQARAALLPNMFGNELVRGLPRVQGDLGPGRHDEPRQNG